MFFFCSDPSRDAGFLDTLPLYNEKTARGYLYYTKLYDYAILLPHVRAEYYSFGYICKAGNCKCRIIPRRNSSQVSATPIILRVLRSAHIGK